MKKIFTCLLMATFVLACTTEQKDLALIPSAQEVNPSETVSFTVRYGETDVTDLAKIFMRFTNEELTSKNWSADIPGDYQFCAIYNDIQSKYVNIHVRQNATLTADKISISATGTDTVTFTVTQNDTDITSESTVYLISDDGAPVALDGFTFSTTETGIYRFYATAGNYATNILQIAAVTDDPEPDNYNFKQRGLVAEFTGTWCGWCAIMKAAAHHLEETGYDNGYSVEIHDGDDMALPYVKELISQFGAGSTNFPLTTFNLDTKTKIVGTYSQTSIEANADRIKLILESCLDEYECTSGISGTYFSDGADGNMKVMATVKIADDGEYRIAAWLCENNIESAQTNYTSDVVNTTDVSMHRNVLRAVSNTSEFTGDDVTAGAGETQEFEWTFDAASLYNGNPEDSHVLIFVTKKQEDDVYVLNNIIKCGFGETVEFEYAE